MYVIYKITYIFKAQDSNNSKGELNLCKTNFHNFTTIPLLSVSSSLDKLLPFFP